MEQLLKSANDILSSGFEFFTPHTWMIGAGFFILIMGGIITGVFKNKRNTVISDTVSPIIMIVGLVVIAVSFVGILSDNDAETNKRLDDFKHQLQTYVESHRQTIPVTGFTCEKEKNSNVVNLTNTNRVNVTAYYEDKNGKVQFISGDMDVYHKGNNPMNIQVTYINKHLLNEWDAGFYEPVLTIPKSTAFSCAK